MHAIAGKAICFKEAMTDEFKSYAQAIMDNAKVWPTLSAKAG